MGGTKPGGAVDCWAGVLRGKIAELDLIADWASVVGLGAVRDHCRKAASELRAVSEQFAIAAAERATAPPPPDTVDRWGVLE